MYEKRVSIRHTLSRTCTFSHRPRDLATLANHAADRPSTVKSHRPSSFLYMANLQTVFFDVQQAVRAAEQAYEQLVFEGNLPSWPCGANPGYILKGAIVALQNGVVGVVAPSATPSEIRVLTSQDDVAVSADEASQGKLSAVARP